MKDGHELPVLEKEILRGSAHTGAHLVGLFLQLNTFWELYLECRSSFLQRFRIPSQCFHCRLLLKDQVFELRFQSLQLCSGQKVIVHEILQQEF